MARRIGKKKTWLPPPDLIERRLVTLVRLLRECKSSKKGELTREERSEWATQIERLLR